MSTQQTAAISRHAKNIPDALQPLRKGKLFGLAGGGGRKQHQPKTPKPGEHNFSNSIVNRAPLCYDPRQELEECAEPPPPPPPKTPARQQDFTMDASPIPPDPRLDRPPARARSGSRSGSRLGSRSGSRSNSNSFVRDADMPSFAQLLNYKIEDVESVDPSESPDPPQRGERRTNPDFARSEGAMRRLNGSRNLGSAASSPLKSSLQQNLEDMGFSSETVQLAIAGCGAESSGDVSRVLEWIANNDDCEHDSRQDNDGDDVRMSADENFLNSLSDMGFTKSQINRNMEAFDDDNTLDADDFITRMLTNEGEATAIPPAPQSAGETGGADNVDLDLLESLMQMGFEQQKIVSVVKDMNKKGRTDLTPFDVLTVILGDDNSAKRDDNKRSTLKFNRSVFRSTLNFNKSLVASSLSNSFFESDFSLSRADDEDDDDDDGEEPLMVEVSPGRHEPLLGGHETWKAIKAGTAVSTECVLCGMALLCCPNAMYVLCPDCNVASPINPIGPTRFRRRGSSSHLQSQRALTSQRDFQSSPRRHSFTNKGQGVGLGCKREL